MIRKWSLTLICAGALFLLAGCASSADNLATPTPAPTAQPTPMATQIPSTMEPDPTMEPPAQPTAVSDSAEAMRIAEAVEEELDKLSEVDDVDALIFGNAALIGIEYDDQYQGGTTDRIRQMVKERIKTIRDGLENVYVTDDPLQVKAIEALKDALEAGDTAFEEIRSQAQEIVDALTDAAGKGTSSPKPADGSAV